MRRISTIILTVAFVAAAFSAFAAETTFSGTYRIRAYSEYNFDKKIEDNNFSGLPGHENAQYDGWFDQRFRLTITHKRSEYLKAVVRLDLVEDTWGQQRNLWINNNNFGNYIDLAYIEFTVPKIGTFTVGKFPETYGHGLAFSDEGNDPSGGFLLGPFISSGPIGLTGARWANSWGPVSASLLYAKVADRMTFVIPIPSLYNWDADLFAINLKVAPTDDHVIELFGGYLQDNEAFLGCFFNSFSWLNYLDAWVFLLPAFYSADVGFAGIAYTGNIADMIDIKFENSYIMGHAHRHLWTAIPFPLIGGPFYPQPTLTIQGYNIYADVSYYNDLLRIGVAFIMGSGQHHLWNSASMKNINMNYISQDDFTFNQILVNGGSGTNSVYGLGSSLFGKNSIENITAVKLYFEICPIEKLTLTASVTWAEWTEDVGINFAGTRAALVTSKGSAYSHPAYFYGNNLYESWDTSDDLGWEVDFGFSYEIMEGLTYSFNMGVLFTGDSWDYEKADGTRGEWGEIWSITNSLVYEF